VGSGERGKGGCVLLYRSQDLRHWEYLHKLVEGKPNGKQAANPCDSGEMWECPDFFPLGNKHCLIYSTENKVLWTTGRYDAIAHTYTPERSGVLDHGAAYYAPKSFAAPGGRRILWGWLRETRPEAEFAAAGWSGCMSYPRLLTIGAQGQLEMHPAKEVESLRGPLANAKVTEGAPFRRKLDELRCEVALPVNLLSDTVASVRLVSGGLPVWELTLDVPAKMVRCGDTTFPFPGLPWPRPDLRMFLDSSVIESFVGGREALTSRVYGMNPRETELEVSVKGKDHVSLQTWPLQAISADKMTGA
jgi:beta-fructofuranosidase